MIRCAWADKDKKSRDIIEKLIKKVKGIKLVKTYALPETAAKACLKDKIDILFVRLYMFPVPEYRMELLKEAAANGTKIVVLSARIRIAEEAFDLKAVDFIILPTSAR